MPPGARQSAPSGLGKVSGHCWGSQPGGATEAPRRNPPGCPDPASPAPGAELGPGAPARGERGAARQTPPLIGSAPLPALTLAPERRHQRQEQEQPQWPGPAEVVHRPPAAPRRREHSHRAGAWLSCSVRWAPPLLLAAASDVIPAA